MFAILAVTGIVSLGVVSAIRCVATKAWVIGGE
jgi:hypothetical protein